MITLAQLVSIHAPRCRGAMPPKLGNFSRVALVSIHAPRCRGAMHLATPSGENIFTSFNPRPSLPRGDAWSGSVSRAPSLVSIHAPRCRGAMRHLCQHRVRKRPFQSTPLVAEGRCFTLIPHFYGLGLFQSTPLVAEGRCAARKARQKEKDCFNPRPSLPRGDANSASSIRAFKVLFQSTPLVAEGRCRSARPANVTASRVSIHAPRCRGAMQQSADQARVLLDVSIHAPRCRGAMRASA